MAQNRSTWLGCSLCSILAVVFLLQTMNQETEGANILGVFPGHGPSHLIVHMSVMKALAEKGHNVTTISTIVPKVKHKNIKQIVVPLISEEEEKLLSSGISGMAKEKGSIWSTMKIMVSSMSMMVEKQVELLEHPSFHELHQNKDNKFDVVFGGFFVNSYLVGLGARFNAPVIICWSGAPMLWVNKFLGNPEQSTVPQMQIGVAQGKTMTFQQRIQNFVSSLSFDALDAYLEIKYKHFYNRIWGSDKSMPSYEEAKQNVSLVFCNSHAISEGPIRANVPAVIEVGGIQIKDKPDPLPQDIKDFLDKAKNGAVLFSLGSNLKGEHIKPDVVDTIFKALSSIKQQVVWKWEDLEKTPGKSSNILYKKWLPQDDILAHPNIKLFITHAGKGGVSEAQYHGVPMLALPVFGDQPGNADKLALSGYGLSLDLNTMKVEELTEAIKEITGNPKYAQKLKSFSQLYRDRPLSAKESVVYWTEYVIRHHGAPHMQSPLVKMSFIASNNYDIYILAVLVLYILLKINKIFWLFIWRKFVAKKTQKTKLKQN